MTEQEAIKIINEEKSWESDDRKIDAFIMAIDALEEIQKYRELERKLNGVDLTMPVNTFMEKAAEGEMQGYQRGRVLTNEDADKWYAYLAIGTPEECRAAVEKQKAKKANKQGIVDSNGKFHTWNGINGKPYLLCPNCGTNLCCEMPYDKKPKYCDDCGQKLDWSDEDDN